MVGGRGDKTLYDFILLMTGVVVLCASVERGAEGEAI